jgi:hypothetical protein
MTDPRMKYFNDKVSEAAMKDRADLIRKHWKKDRNLDRGLLRVTGSIVAGIGGAKLSELIANKILKKKLARLYYLNELPTKSPEQSKEIKLLRSEINNKLLLAKIGGGLTAIGLANLAHDKIRSRAKASGIKDVYKRQD